MIRRLVFALIAFAAPLAINYLYQRLAGRSRAAPGWVWAAAVLLALATFIVPPLLEPKGNARYVPAHMENGRLVPDREVPAP